MCVVSIGERERERERVWPIKGFGGRRMSPTHAHSASVGNLALSEMLEPAERGAHHHAYSLSSAAGGGGLSYYTPLNALQLPNGDIVPYDQQEVLISGVDRLSVSPVPVRLLVPTYSCLLEGESRGGGRGGFPGSRGRYGRHKSHRSEDFELRRGGGYRARSQIGSVGGGRNGGGGNNNSNSNTGSNNNNNNNNSNNGGSRRSRGVQKELKENVRRTIYISDIDQLVTEEELATFFADCGSVIDCRVCGDPNSAKRFAFIEFTDEQGAGKALEKSGAIMGSCSIRVLPSKTAIVPVNKDFMPKNMQEMELCSRTVYVANIDKKVDKHDVKRFFESLCGKVTKLRLLGDYAHSTRIAFVEFTVAESALAALNCSGAVLGTLPIRVSPSKAPVRMCSASDCED